jgi:microcystin-dependent protein
MQIAQNQPLFSLLGTTYGGDARTTFALPDLRGRVPLNLGENFTIGQRGGQEAHLLSEAEMPAHSHALMANATSQNVGPTPSPATVLGISLGKSLPLNTPFTANLYSTAGANAQLAGAALGGAGSGQPHPNMMPSLALSFCISLAGEFPSRG